MKYFSFLLLCIIAALPSQAKIWRVNNNAGVNADFTTFNDACTNASVIAGDTIHLEPSGNDYQTFSFTLDKRLVIIGAGFFLDPSNPAYPPNAGLQAAQNECRVQFFRLGANAAGTKIMGLIIQGGVNLVGTSNISFEKVCFVGGTYFENGTISNVSYRKCFFLNGAGIGMSGSAVVSSFVCENSIFYNGSGVGLATLTGSGNLFRNNSLIFGGASCTMVNTYIANNIFGSYNGNTFTNCTIKNNLFGVNQTLPGTATNNQVSVNMTNVYVGGSTGSLDSRAMLKTGSPAIGAGLTVGAVTSPDCGAFGATDPYRLSGIPAIPSIYTYTVPTSIPSGSTTMNVTFSTRNNN